MCCVNSPSVTDWIMVGITFVYVVATAFIFLANKKSAEAAEKQLQQAKEQLEESKEQFKESQRLECMPFLQLETIRRTDSNKDNIEIAIPPSLLDDVCSGISKHFFVLRNLGKGTAINLFYAWEDSSTGHDSTSCPSISAIMSGDSYQIKMETKVDEDIEGWIEWHFDDMIQHHYHQKVKIKIANNHIEECDNDQVVYDAEY